jgi:hypothetical protein
MRQRRPRTQLTLPPAQQAELERRARRAGLPASTYAARFVLDGLNHPNASLGAAVGQPAAPPPQPRPAAGARAPWLPPDEHVDAILDLIARYPHDLRDLRQATAADILADTTLAERLSSLACWRAQIDAGTHTDPRTELAWTRELDGVVRWWKATGRRLQRTPRTARDAR